MSDVNTNLGRVVSNIVDIQQTIVCQFDQVTRALEALKLDSHNNIASLREDLRRTDDRAQKQVEELRAAHNKEVERLTASHTKENERLHLIIQTLLARDVAPQKTAAPLITAASAMQNQLCLMQQQEALQRMLAANVPMGFQQQQQPVFPSSPAVSSIIQSSAPVMVPTKPIDQSLSKLSITGSSTPQQPITSTTIKTEQKPVVKFEPQQISSVKDTKPLLIIPKTETVSKVETEKPAVSKVDAEKPAVSFGSSTGPFGMPKLSAEKPQPKEGAAVVTEKDEDVVEEYEPEVHFEPVIPLPELVEVVTGEENETELFSEKCKLYRFADSTNEWKERGIGVLRVLQDKETKKCRVVMRREQVLKVCANHFLVRGMTIQFMAKNEKALTWFCEDFSEETYEQVKLSARFATPEIAKNFKAVFEKGIADYPEGSSGKTPVKPTKEKLKESETKVEEKQKEIIIPKNKVEQTTEVGFGDKFKPKPGSWECQACYVSNTAETNKCTCCGAGKDGKDEDKSASIFSKNSILQPTPGQQKFTFGLSAAAAAKDQSPLQAQTMSPVFGASISSTGTPKSSIFGGGPKTDSTNKSDPNPTLFSQFNFKRSEQTTHAIEMAGQLDLNRKATEPKTAAPIFLFKNTSTTTTTPAAPVSAAASPVTFSFNKTAATPTTGSLFGTSKLFGAKTEEKSDEKPAEQPKAVFGSFVSGGETFASLAAKSKANIFEGEAAKKAQEEFKAQKKGTAFTGRKDEEAEEGGADEEYEPDVDFKPVVPLPELVDVVTGEEGEDELFKARCKLFRYVPETKENKERGIGDVKILHNEKTDVYRVVMRREQVHKLCANFRVSKDIKLQEKPRFANVYTFMCTDFSEDIEKGIPEIFTIKFKDEKLAMQFNEKFTEAQKKLK